MALSGLGPALSGAYANVARLRYARHLEEEERERRRQEAIADREAQHQYQIKLHMFLERMRREAEPPEPFETLGQYAEAAGRKLLNPQMAGTGFRALRAAGVSPESFLAPREDPRAAAQERIRDFLRWYTPQQIQSDPRLLAEFVAINRAAGGFFPTGTEREMETVPTPLPLVARTGAGAGVQPTTTQVPTGREVTVPLFPWPAKEPQERTVIVDNTGKVVQVLDLPKGSRVETVTPPRPEQPARYLIVDSTGRVVREIVAPPGTKVQQLPTPPAGADRSGLSPTQKRILTQFDTLDKRLDSLLARHANLLDEKDPRAKAIEGTIRDIERRRNALLRANPWMASFVGVEPAPAGAGRTGTTDNDPLGIRVPGTPVGGAVRKPVATTVGPSGPLTTAQINQIVDQAASRGAPFPLAQLRAAGVSESIISLLRQRYQTMRR